MIRTGTKVNVFWEYVPAELGVTVACMPNRPDGWWICTRDDGTEVIIKSFSKIEEAKADA